LARNLNELLQELRVAQAGVQILFGFLLSIAFTDRYASADGYIRVTHLITVLFAAGAVALLTAPAAWHRLLFRRGRREDVIEVANRFAIVGLACLAVAMTGTILLLGEVIAGGWVAIVLGVFAAVVFGTLWFAWPWRERVRDTISEGEDDEDRLE
jgi:fatty acid desaturase